MNNSRSNQYNYKELGLKAGLEIHQQLDSYKLFCNCPSEIIERDADFSIKRILFPSPGETGEIDIAALHERKKMKYFIYEGFEDKTCLVEIDEEPPKEINKEALKIALTIAKLMKTKIFDEIHVMRKTVVDGSNTSGFQRTALIAEDGFIELKNGKKLGIESICLEEDSARKMREDKDYIVYRLDRLGIPLVEITTKADLNSPEEVKEAAQKIGLLLRATKVKRGLGTIRQDVNVSIRDGERVEIKGVQNLDLIEEIVKNEVKRQIDLINLREELWERIIKNNLIKEHIYYGEKDEEEIRKLNSLKSFKEIEKFLFKEKNNKSKIFKEEIKNKIVKKLIKGFYYSEDNEILKEISKKTESKVIKDKELALLSFNDIMDKIFGKEIGLKRFGSELAMIIKQYGFKGLFHSDEKLTRYGIKDKEINKLKKISNVFILLAYKKEEKENVRLAFEAIMDRIAYALIGVPKETRKANEDGSTSFLRPMPGKARMYPETDLPLFKTRGFIPSDKELPKTLEEIEEELRNLLGKELASQLIKHYKLKLFLEIAKKSKNPKLIAYLFTNLEKELKRDYDIELNEKEYLILADLLERGIINKEALIDLIVELKKDINTVRTQSFSYSELYNKYIKKIEDLDLKKLNNYELEKKVKDFLEKNKDKDEKKLRGLIIKEFRKKSDMKELMSLINQLITKK